MMFFDAKAALAKIQSQTPATSAIPAISEAKKTQNSGNSGNSSTPCPETAILSAIKSGASRPGAIASDADLGTTVTYQLLDKLIADGLVLQAPDGTLLLKETCRPHGL